MLQKVQIDEYSATLSQRFRCRTYPWPHACTTRVLSTTGGESFAPPQKKSFTEKKLQLFQTKIFFDDDFKEPVKVANVLKCNSANPEHYIFKLFLGSIAADSLEGLTKFFLAATWLKKLFQDRLPPPPPHTHTHTHTKS